MKEKNGAALDGLTEDSTVDKMGVVNLDQCKDASLQKEAVGLLPGAKSILVMAMEMFPETIGKATSRALVGEMTMRDLYLANSDVVDGLLGWEGYKLVKKLHDSGFKGLLLPATGSPYDARFLRGPLSYKGLAEAAGMGVIGWNSLLLTPEYGGRVRLAAVITDAPLPTTPQPRMQSPCVKCGGACIRICPAGAIKKPSDGEVYNIDKHACSSYYSASGMCAECLRVCPAGKKSAA